MPPLTANDANDEVEAENYVNDSGLRPYAPEGTGTGLKLVSSDIVFGPLFPPDTYRARKDRNPNRNEKMCEGEDVSDSGGKNREVHLSGMARERERHIIEKLMDYDKPLYMSTLGWSGEIRVSEIEYEGPVAVTPGDRELLWRYTMDLISTGKSESGGDSPNGIVQ